MKTAPKKGSRCNECPLFEPGVVVRDFDPMRDGSGLALVGEMPGFKEVQVGLPMVGPTGHLLEAICKGIGKPYLFESLYRTNCILCGLPRGAKPTESAMAKAADCCRDLVLDNLKAAGISTVLCLGAVPTLSLRGLKGIAKYRGTVDFGEPTMTSTYHPAFMLKQEEARHLTDIIGADILKAVALAEGTIQPFESLVDVVDPLESGSIGALSLLEDIAGEHPLIAVDIETTDDESDRVDALSCKLLTVGIAVERGGRYKAVSIPWPKAYPSLYDRSTAGAVERWLKRVLTAPRQRMVFHNKSFDVLVLERYFGELPGVREDTLLMHHATFPKCPHDLQSVASQFLAVEPWKDIYKASETSIFKQIEKVEGWDEDDGDEDEGSDKTLYDLQRVQVSELLYYNSMDAATTLAVVEPLLEEARGMDTLKVYETDRELVDRSMYWTQAGIGIDLDRQRTLAVDKVKCIEQLRAALLGLSLLPEAGSNDAGIAALAVELEGLRKEARALKKAGDLEAHADVRKTMEVIRARVKVLRDLPTRGNFNPNSSRHLLAVLRERKVTPTKITAKNVDADGIPLPSTSKKSLWPKRDDEFVDTLFVYRRQQKLYSTYLKYLPSRIGPDTRLHPSWKLHSTPTGRFGSAPAVQNWPRDMRVMMRPAPGCVFVRADYSQIELRIAALLSDEASWIEVFQSGGDLHAMMAYEYFPVEFPDLDAQWRAVEGDDDAKDAAVPRRTELRKRGKNVTFGDIYLAGANTLYEQIREKMDDVQTREDHDRLKREVAVMQSRLRAKTPNRIEWARLQAEAIAASGYVKTPAWRHADGEWCGGRIRRYPMAKTGISPNEAANTPIQGMAADIMSKATRLLCQRLEKLGLYRDGVWIVLQVHDELTLEVEDRVVRIGKRTAPLPEHVKDLLEECMYMEITHRSIVTGRENTMPFPAPAKVVVYSEPREKEQGR